MSFAFRTLSSRRHSLLVCLASCNSLWFVEIICRVRTMTTTTNTQVLQIPNFRSSLHCHSPPPMHPNNLDTCEFGNFSELSDAMWCEVWCGDSGSLSFDPIESGVNVFVCVCVQGNTLRPYLTCIRNTLTAAMCLQNFPCQEVERHNKPEVEFK